MPGSGGIRLQLGDFSGAESDFRAAESALSSMAHSSGDLQAGLFLGQVRGSLGVALMSQGRHGEAEKAYCAAIDDGLALLKGPP